MSPLKVGMLYAVAKASMEETGGGEGVEVLKNESYADGEPLLNGRFTKGQYTDKIYHLESKVPAMIRYRIKHRDRQAYCSQGGRICASDAFMHPVDMISFSQDSLSRYC